MSTNTTSPTLAEFVAARLDEDETVAQMAGHGCGYLHEHNAGWLEVELPDAHNARPSYDLLFIRENSPARVLPAGRAILAPLATIYADHKDYDESWRP